MASDHAARLRLDEMKPKREAAIAHIAERFNLPAPAIYPARKGSDVAIANEAGTMLLALHAIESLAAELDELRAQLDDALAAVAKGR